MNVDVCFRLYPMNIEIPVVRTPLCRAALSY